MLNTFIFVFLLGGLGIYMLILWAAYNAWTPTTNSLESKNQLPFSIIIPARNESDNIIACLQSILNSNYPKSLVDIIVIDDHSEDDTAKKASSLNMANIRVTPLAKHLDKPINNYKKWAISVGLGLAKYEHILTLDADCTIGPNRLSSLNAIYQENQALCIAGPIQIQTNGSLLGDFQCLDNAGMMAITNLGIKTQYWHLANGANFSFTKTIYNQNKNKQDGQHLASGDDVFMIQSIAKNNASSIFFNNHPYGLVDTAAMTTIKDLISQRARWAAKNGQYKQIKLNALMGFIWVLCFCILLCVCISPLYGLIALTIKMMVDTIYLSLILPFFKISINSSRRLLLSAVHTVYVAIFGVLSLVSPSFHWKGRKVK